MYEDSIKVINKIISYEDLFDIFAKMYEKLNNYQKTYRIEEMKNRMLDSKYHIWTFEDQGSKLTFDVRFYDNTQIKFDNYNNFISIFTSRLDEIKSIDLYYVLTFATKEEGKTREYCHHSINMVIYEHRIDISLSLNSKDNKMNDIYELLKHKISSAPQKYDDVIKKKGLISTIVTLGIGFIPALIITTALFFVPTIRYIFSSSYVLYPIANILLAFVIGGIFGNSKLDKYYKSISPEKKSAGFDITTGRRYYKDDIDQYISTSEVLIGKNADNLKCRKEIEALKNKFKKFIPYELIGLILISILVVLL